MSQEKASRINFYGNPFIGIFAKTNNHTTIVSATSPEKFTRVSERLRTDEVRVMIANSDLIGIYAVMNDNGILLSGLAEKGDQKVLEAKLAELKRSMNVMIMGDKYTAIGNSVAVNNHGALVNPNIEDKEVVKEISDILGVEVFQERIAGMSTVGAAVVATDKGFACHPNATVEQLKFLKEVFNVEGGVATANGGVPFVAFSVVANNNGVMFGEQTTGFEMHRLMETLGLI